MYTLNTIIIIVYVICVHQKFVQLVIAQQRNDIPEPFIINKPLNHGGSTEKPRYAVLAPRLVRPSSLYAIAMVALPGLDRSMMVRASLSRDGVELAASERSELRPGGSQRLLMRVPGSSVPGVYSLRVDGVPVTGGLGSMVFSNTTELEFSPRFLTILIQTSRPLYCTGQDGESSVESIVRFRIILLRMDMKPFDEGVTVYILDPEGLVMKRWLSTQTNNGVVSLTYQLPRLAREGRWHIKVEARGQVETQQFQVSTHFVPIFEVLMFAPKYVVAKDESYTVTVNAIGSSERLARGNCTLHVYGERLVSARHVRGAGQPPKLLWSEKVFLETGVHSWDIPLSKIEAHMGSALAGTQVKAEVTVFETFFGYTRSGYTHTRIIGGNLKLRFLGAAPHIFRPGMPFEGQVAVSYDDDERVPEAILRSSRLTIRATAILESGGRIELPELVVPSEQDLKYEVRDDWDERDVAERMERYILRLSCHQFHTQGIHSFKLMAPQRALRMEIRATFTPENGELVAAQLNAVRYFSPGNKYISVTTSTEDAQPGEYAIFHVTSNFMMEDFLYIVMSKGILLLSETLDAESDGATSLSIPVSPEMSPSFHLVVVAVTRQGELVTDSVWVPVEGLSMHKASLKLNEAKDHTRETVEFEMRAQPGAFFATQTLNIFMYELQAGSEITRARVLRALHSFENSTRSMHRVAWRSRDGTKEDESAYFKSMSYGADANRTIQSAGLLIFTDAYVPEMPGARDGCNISTGLRSCLTRGCYPETKHCDGRRDCSDGSDETGCFDNIDFKDEINYTYWRQSGYTDLYQLGDGDWGWYEQNIGHHGREYKQVNIAAVSNMWYVSAFSVSKDHGIAVIERPQVQDSSRPIFASIEGPSQCRRGEQIGLRLMVFNRRSDVHEMLVSIVLHASDDYKFVHVEENGVVSSFGARLTGGEHHHLVWLPEGGERQVDLPIAPTVEVGEVEVQITISTQYGIRRLSHSINVLGEGAPVSGHTSVFLDLKARATVLRYLDIPVEESPIVPYHDWRRYVYGSPVGSIILSSDLIGPVFPSVPLTTVNLVDRWLKGTEARVSELAANVWTLHYLRLTNRLTRPRLREVLGHVTTIFAQVMMRFNATSGAFHNWDTSPPSVWVTSWALRAFRHASFQDWDDLFYIEPRIINKAVSFLLENQAPSGSFYEPDAMYARSPLDQRMHASQTAAPNSTSRYGPVPRNVTLTAHVLISLQEAIGAVQGSLRSDAASARDRAARYLEKQLHSMKDPYEIAITAYALTLCDSVEKDLAFRLLSSKALEGSEGELYWSRIPIPANPVKYENQRPFIQPASIVEGDSVAVEATSYALQTYVAREGVAIDPERIVQWLLTVHVTYLGYYSTVESVTALQALTEFAFRARQLDITDMSVTLELPSANGLRYELHVMGNDTEASHFSTDIPAVWGHLNVIARGHGQALVQMDVAWGVDFEELKDAPTDDTFEMHVHEYYSQFRNKSSITIQTCFRWVRPHPVTSGAAVLEVEIPTGYHMLESEAIDLAQSGVHPTLREGLTIPGKTLWYFEHIPPDMTCFNHTVMRWFPAANLSLQRSAFLYEMYARERFVQVLVNSTPLYILNICEVCGSYQCPYCPHYSVATFLVPSVLLLVGLSVIQILLLRVPTPC